MKTFVFFAFLAVAFTAAVAAPSVHKPHGTNHAVVVKAIGEDLLLDLISLILGVDVRAIIAQTEVTISGLDALLTASSAELLAILSSGGSSIVADAEAIIENALVRVQEIIKPIVDIINIIVGLVGRRDLIGDLIEALLNQVIGLIEGTVSQLEAVAVETVNALQELALNAGQGIASQVQALLANTVSEAVALVLPLLELIQPLLPRGAKVDIIDLIELITGLPVRAIIAQTEATAAGLEILIPATVSALEAALSTAGSDLVAQAQAIVDQAIADAEALIEPVLTLLDKILDGGNVLLLVPQLILATQKAVDQLPAVAEGAVEALLALANSAGAEAAAAVEAILTSALAEAQALIEPLLELLAPILGGRKVALLK